MRRPPSSRPTLDYGSEETVSLARIVSRSLWALLILTALVTAFRIGFNYGYDYPETSIRSYLKTLTGTRAIRINSYDDGPSVKVLFATVDLPEDPSRSFSLHRPTRDELRAGGHLRLFTFGPWEFQTNPGNGYQTLDVGRDGAFANLLPFPVNGPQDVIDRYDEILQFFNGKTDWTEHVGPDGASRSWRVRSVSWNPGGR